MSRSGYTEEYDPKLSNLWDGAVAKAIRGKRGQSFLRELIEALDAMPEKRLVQDVLEKNGAVCAIGSVGVLRGIDMSNIDVEDYDGIAKIFGISRALAQQIESENDECSPFGETPETRWQRMRDWAVENIAPGPHRAAPVTRL